MPAGHRDFKTNAADRQGIGLIRYKNNGGFPPVRRRLPFLILRVCNQNFSRPKLMDRAEFTLLIIAPSILPIFSLNLRLSIVLICSSTYNRILVKSVFIRRKLYMCGHLSLIDAACYSRGYNGRTVLIPDVILDYQNRTYPSLFASHHRAEIGVINISSFNCHSLFTLRKFFLTAPQRFVVGYCTQFCLLKIDLSHRFIALCERFFDILDLLVGV